MTRRTLPLAPEEEESSALKDASQVQGASRGQALAARAANSQTGTSGLTGRFYEDQRASRNRPGVSDA